MKAALWAAGLAALLAAVKLGAWAGITLAVLEAVGAYLWSCYRRPTADHKGCSGRGKRYGAVWRRANRPCETPWCHDGQVIRAGARLVRAEHVARLGAGKR